MNTIYLDHAAKTPTLHCATEAFLSAPFGNPSSEHAVGLAARDALEQARERIAELMDCEPDEVYFTSTASEGAAWVMNTMYQENIRVTPSFFEHHAISENRIVGRFPDFEWDREPRLDPPYNAFAWMYANNETGEILHASRDPFLCATDKKLWVCDAVSAIGHIPVSFRTLGCDYLIADAIKFSGVPGAAFLIAKRGTYLTPLIRGGGQERGMRSGTENVPAICAMAAALEWQTQHMEENTAKLSSLFAFLQTELSKIPGVLWNTPLDRPHLPHILNVSFTDVNARALSMILSKEGIMVSPGAACSNGLNEPSHVIMAMFHDEARARGAIRISMSHENTMGECKIAATKIKEAVAHLRNLSV